MPRFKVLGKKDDGSLKVSTRKQKTTEKWETSISGQAMQFRPDEPFQKGTPLLLGALFFRPIPQYISNSKKKLEQALSLQLVPAVKPDIKNLVASLEDAMEGIFYINDSSIVGYIPVDGLPIGKYYSKTPRVEVVLVPRNAYFGG